MGLKEGKNAEREGAFLAYPGFRRFGRGQVLKKSRLLVK